MGRMRENPRYNVISMRVSDEERDQLENLMKTTHKSISDIMREAMEYFSAHYEQGSMDHKAVA
ncbi:MAG TPA: ribbon-helix-helix protein, CopG family [Desulfuromonadales bacterium]|nr:ribbon-helix-helix protein, CopG family [Desulfuromonadales bacterium]